MSVNLDDLTKSYADPCLQGDTWGRPQVADASKDGQSRAYRAFGVVLVRRRIAEIGQHAVAQILRDHAAQPVHLARAVGLERAHHLALLLRVEPRREPA